MRGAPREGEACVPGGSFFFGDPAFRGRAFANDVVDERLVWVSPFYLDQTEVTVGAFRARWPELAAAGATPPLALYGGATAASRDRLLHVDRQPTRVAACHSKSLPLSCVSWETARAFCRAKGADLPTEAQLEYASSGLGEERAFAWGYDEPDCTGSRVGTGRARAPFATARAHVAPLG